MQYEHISGDPDNNSFDVNKFVPVVNNPWPKGKPKPGSGLWASLASGDDNWRRWLRYNGRARSERGGFRFDLSEAAGLLVVRSECDMETLPKVTDRDGIYTREGINWEQLALDWDAVFVEGEALYTEMFYTWDVPSLVVLNVAAVVPEDSGQPLLTNL